MTTEGRGVQSIEVGGRLLSALVEVRRPIMLKELAKLAGVASAQAHAYLASYRKLQIVEQDPETGLYRLGPHAMQLGVARLRSADPARIVSDGVRRFAADVGLMVAVVVWGSHGPTVVQVEEGREQIYVNTRPGTIFSISGTASGRVFAAHLSDRTLTPRIKAEMAARGQDGVVGHAISAKELAAKIETIREVGYAITEGRPVPHINAIAAPVFEHTGHLRSVITVIGRDTELDVAEVGDTHHRLVAFSREMSSRLGHDG